MLQQHPSSARLGLTTANPSSPSLPPPPSSSSNPTAIATATATTTTTTNPKPPPLPPSTATTTTTTTTSSHNRLSPSLLPLLPPLPRAHSLLLQLSSHSSRLFDTSPHRPSFLATPSPLPTYPILPDPDPSSSSSSSSSLQSQLLSSVQDLQSILQLRDSLSSLSRRISSLDSSLLSFARKMNDARHLLDLLLDDYSHYRLPTKRRKNNSNSSTPSSSSFSPLPLPLEDLLSHAHRISYTTFAPPEFGAGHVPLRGALPPAPQEEQMRASQLYHAASLDLGVPKADAGDRAAERLWLLESLIEPTPPRDEAPQPPGLPAITVPAGWRKGMPIDLPKDLPPLPPGWKPGDPIQLPLMEAIGVGAGKGEEQQRRPVAAAVPPPGVPALQPRQPEPIQVKYVQLDINPEDEYSSDYSSDGSSEEDDED